MRQIVAPVPEVTKHLDQSLPAPWRYQPLSSLVKLKTGTAGYLAGRKVVGQQRGDGHPEIMHEDTDYTQQGCQYRIRFPELCNPGRAFPSP